MLDAILFDALKSQGTDHVYTGGDENIVHHQTLNWLGNILFLRILHF